MALRTGPRSPTTSTGGRRWRAVLGIYIVGHLIRNVDGISVFKKSLEIIYIPVRVSTMSSQKERIILGW
jgi:hypothetical protein